MLFKRVTIIGPGLIGASMGMALREKGLSEEVIGVGRRESSLDMAIQAGAIDRATLDLREGVTNADMVVLATGITTSLRLGLQAFPHLKEGCILTDVASTKSFLINGLEGEVPAGVSYVSAHPMAGSEWKGVDAADPFLFQNAIYVLTPSPGCDPSLIDRLAAVTSRIGAHVVQMEPEKHDRVAAAISHLPQMMATALVGLVGGLNEKDGLSLKLAAGGFRDMTRIASSPYEMWRDICRTNATPIRETIDAYISVLTVLRGRIEDEALADDFSYANEVRDRIPRDSKGFLYPLHELMLVVEDKPGVIAEVATSLSDAGINIKDIEVLKVREGEGGSLRLGFGASDEKERAGQIMTALGYTVLSR